METFSKHKVKSRRSGTLPITEKNEIVFISSTKYGDWILPKGGIEIRETSKETALRETIEEAGVFGSIDDLPFYMDESFEWYILRVNKIYNKWYEDDRRKRVLIPLEEVLKNKNGKIRKSMVKLVKYALKNKNIFLNEINI